MNRLATLLLALLAYAAAYGQFDAKRAEKESRALARQLTKDGWQLDGDSRPMAEVLLQHAKAMATTGGEQVEGNASRCRSLNICRQVARNNAAAIRMATMEGRIEGEIERQIATMQAGGEAVSVENFRAEYRQKAMQQIKDEMRESYAIVRDNGDGTMDYRMYFVVDLIPNE